MQEPQDGIFDESGEYHHYLEYATGSDSDTSEICSALAAFVRDDRSLAVKTVLAFGAEFWGKLSADAPGGLCPFEPLGAAPSTQRDIWIWLQGDRPDLNLDAAMKAHHHLGAVAELELELTGFSYHGNRDLIGFVDGTANPKDREAKEAAALIPGGNGGAFVLTQKWVHDLDAFNALELAEQEAVVGRTKEDDVELEGDAMPATSHVSRTDVSEDGVGLKIYRRSSPYGTVTEKGLYFVAFACDIRRFDVQLRRMFGLTEDGLIDRITEFSTAVTGAYWYAPGQAELRKALDL